MATSTVGSRSRGAHQKQLELEEARKAGLMAPEIGEDGKQVNPHIPHYISTTAWYLNPNANANANANTAYSLKHQRKRRSDAIYSAERKKSYDAKRDPWEGYNDTLYSFLVQRKFASISDNKKDFKIKENNFNQSKQKSTLGKLEKRVSSRGSGSTGTVRNLRIREDTAKYILNLDVNSAYYDPKSRSMREDPTPNMDPTEKFFKGDNESRKSGEASDFEQLNIYAWEACERGQEVQLQAAPSQAEYLFKNYKTTKEALRSQLREKILDKYGDASCQEELPKEVLLGL